MSETQTTMAPQAEGQAPEFDQAVPEIAKQAAHVYVFQRTPNYDIPGRTAAPSATGPGSRP